MIRAPITLVLFPFPCRDRMIINRVTPLRLSSTPVCRRFIAAAEPLGTAVNGGSNNTSNKESLCDIHM